ncbi:hypothetical protein EOM71_01345 [Candidatus Falkowbacteria bacterium]|nr:hypothetical protein [Candidatus Falkowbacteria bacterium]
MLLFYICKNIQPLQNNRAMARYCQTKKEKSMLHLLWILWLPVLAVTLLKQGLIKYGSFKLTNDGQVQYFWLNRQISDRLAKRIAHLISPWPLSRAQKFGLLAAGLSEIHQPHIWGVWQIPEKLYKKARPLASHQNIIKVTS